MFEKSVYFRPKCGFEIHEDLDDQLTSRDRYAYR